SNLVITITTNDSSVFSFAAATNTVSESNGPVTLTVNRTGTTNNTASVNFRTTNGTALAGSDYIATNGTLTLGPGVTTTNIIIPLIDDDLQESTKSFRVILSGPVDGTVGLGTNLVILTDDDVSTVAFTTNAITVSEAGVAISLDVVRS